MTGSVSVVDSKILIKKFAVSTVSDLLLEKVRFVLYISTPTGPHQQSLIWKLKQVGLLNNQGLVSKKILTVGFAKDCITKVVESS